jgi:natural product precursor
MKTKKITKKLELNKKTLSNLNDAKMKDVKGGWHYPATYVVLSCYNAC